MDYRKIKKIFVENPVVDKNLLSLSFFSFSGNFLQLVENILNESVSQGNIDIYIGPDREDIGEHYSNITRWSDFRVFVPTLFNFFHGIELLLKGAIYKMKLPTGTPNHNLSKLLSEFKSMYPNASILTAILDKYIYPKDFDCKILFSFYTLNGFKDSSQFIEFLKYPYSKDFQTDFNHSGLRNLGREGVDFFRQILGDIKTIRNERTKL